MFGGIPKTEVSDYQCYWDAFPGLKEALFEETLEGYVQPRINEIKQLIANFASVERYRQEFIDAFNGFYETLQEDLIEGVLDVIAEHEKEKITGDIFKRIDSVKLADRYVAYQVFAEYWDVIAADIEMLQTEGFEVITQVDPNMVIKKKNKDSDDDDVTEVQDGWKGHILPFDLIQRELLPENLHEVEMLEERLAEIGEAYAEIIESMEEDEKEGKYLNDTNDAFVAKELKTTADEILKDVDSAEISALRQYLSLSKKKEKIEYMLTCKEVDWEAIEKGNDGTCKKTSVNNRIQQLQSIYEFPENSFENKIVSAINLMDEESRIKKDMKQKKDALHLKTKEVIEGLSEEEALKIVEYKWIRPLVESLIGISDNILSTMIDDILYLSGKYATTMQDIQEKKSKTSSSLSEMIETLIGPESDMDGLKKFKEILGGQ